MLELECELYILACQHEARHCRLAITANLYIADVLLLNSARSKSIAQAICHKAFDRATSKGSTLVARHHLSDADTGILLQHKLLKGLLVRIVNIGLLHSCNVLSVRHKARGYPPVPKAGEGIGWLFHTSTSLIKIEKIFYKKIL